MNNFDINTLAEMYHANIRTIEQLQYSNGEIRNAIIELINQRNSLNPRRNIYSEPVATNYNHNYRRDNNNRNNRTAGRNHRAASRPIQPQNTPVLTPELTPRNTSTYNTIIDHIFRNNNRNNNINNSFLDPVVVCPTAEQIERATRNVLYRDIVRPTNSSCPITLDAFSDDEQVTMIRACSHIFNRIAVQSWFRTNCRCPVCRYDIRQESLHDIIPETDSSLTVPENYRDISGNYFDSSGNYVDASGNIHTTYDITSMTFSFFTTDSTINNHLEEPE